MKLNQILMSSALLASLSMIGCSKDSPAGRLGENADKTGTKAQMVGLWESACDSKNILWQVANIKSSRVYLDFFGESKKRVKFYADTGCNTEVGQAVYSGTTDLGAASAPNSASILDLNYTNVSVTITDQATADLLNQPTTPGCGISDWQLNQARDVSAAAGGLNCPIPKTGVVFDIVKTDGQTLHLGLSDVAHDKMTADKRPVALDMDNGFSKK